MPFLKEFSDYRAKCGMLWSYDWISIPLVYTQVVTLATYSFFLAALVGRQYVDDANAQRKKQFQMEVDIYLPVFTILQFFFYMGLLKVAEQLINPFGDDDEDFELNWLIDRHLKVSYLGVDILMARNPPLVKDKYFDDTNLILPYTEAAVAYKKKTYRGSVHNMLVPEDQQSMFLPEISEADEDDVDSSKHGSTPKKNSSFTNVLHAVSPAAGIWRPSKERAPHPHCTSVETNNEAPEVKLNIGKFETRAPWHRQHNVPVHPSVFTGLHLWSSQSTLDSVDSAQFISISPHQQQNQTSAESQQNDRPSEIVLNIKKTDSLDAITLRSSSVSSVATTKSKRGSKIFKHNSTGNIALSLKHSFSKHLKDLKCGDQSKLRTILHRRQSNSSGQWKGIRWKPVIDDSSGDVWSDNCYRRQTSEHCKHLPAPLHISSDSVSSSFHSIDSHHMTITNPQLQFNKIKNKKVPSKSFSNVSENNISGHRSRLLSSSSLPNLTITVSPPPVSKINSTDQSLLLALSGKSFSSSPRQFSKLEDTIEEET